MPCEKEYIVLVDNMVRPLQKCRKGAGIGIDPGKNDTLTIKHFVLEIFSKIIILKRRGSAF